MIKFVQKSKLYPAFGRAYPGHDLIEIRSDLPKITRKFLISHESFHLRDKAKNWIWREIKANVYAGFLHPVGAASRLRVCPSGEGRKTGDEPLDSALLFPYNVTRESSTYSRRGVPTAATTKSHRIRD